MCAKYLIGAWGVGRVQSLVWEGTGKVVEGKCSVSFVLFGFALFFVSSSLSLFLLTEVEIMCNGANSSRHPFSRNMLS